MKRKRVLIPLAVICMIVLIMILLPKEEELYTKPVIEAYQNDEFDMAEVKRGDLIKKENISLTVQNIGEKQFSFPYDDFSYKGIYVSEGETVAEGQLLAELSAQGKEKMIADSSKLELRAPFDGIVTYVLEPENGEKSIGNQTVAIINESNRFVLSAFTPFWNLFNPGDIRIATVLGQELSLTVVDADDIGVEKFSATENEPARVYFTVQEDDLLLYSGIPGSLELMLDTRENVLYIPSRAVNLVNGEEIVYVEDADGIRSIKSISTGLDTGTFIEVTEGLSLGDKVILD